MRFSKAGSTFPRWPVRAANWPRVQSCRKVTKIFYAINAGRVFVFPEGADFDDFGKIHMIVFWTEPTKMRLSTAGIRLSLDQGRFRAGFLRILGSIFWWNLRFIPVFIGFSVGRPMALH
jgi:hypothetical protein